MLGALKGCDQELTEDDKMAAAVVVTVSVSRCLGLLAMRWDGELHEFVGQKAVDVDGVVVSQALVEGSPGEEARESDDDDDGEDEKDELDGEEEQAAAVQEGLAADEYDVYHCELVVDDWEGIALSMLTACTVALDMHSHAEEEQVSDLVSEEVAGRNEDEP